MTEHDEPAEASVLASLPRTRPQRRSPKRDAVQAAQAPREPAPTVRAAATRGAPIAPQGYEADTGRGAVEPPSRTDLLGSVVQGAGDLAHIGLDAGRHVLRAILDRLPTP